MKSLRGWQTLPTTIWVVDNASDDGEADLIKQNCPEARLIRSTTNRGFAGGNNLGIRAALEADSDMVLLLNNDASIDEDNTRTLADSFCAHPNPDIVGPVLHETQGNQMRISAGGRDIARHITTHILLESPVSEQVLQPVNYVPGTVAMIRAEVFEKTGFFDENYFFSGEMADFCQRARQHDYQTAIVPQAIAKHNLDHAGELRSTLYTYYSLRNRFLYTRKFAPAPWLAFWVIYCLAQAVWQGLRGRFSQARAIGLAMLDGLAGGFGDQNEYFQP